MNKKDIILIILLIIFIIILIFLTGATYNTIANYSCEESFLESMLEFQNNNEETVFSIDKITYFSSCDANIDTNSNSSFKISDLFQYTDIAIFINPNSDKLSPKNTLKSVALNNIHFSTKPSIGTPNLYYKNINDFATTKFLEDDLIKDSIVFETTSADTIDYSNPVLYTLHYVNSKLQDEFTLENTVSKISRNGSLLKTCAITLNSLSCKINFDMTITNNLDEIYTCPVSFNIPLSTESNTIYEGNLTLKDMVHYNFIKN